MLDMPNIGKERYGIAIRVSPCGIPVPRLQKEKHIDDKIWS